MASSRGLRKTITENSSDRLYLEPGAWGIRASGDFGGGTLTVKTQESEILVSSTSSFNEGHYLFPEYTEIELTGATSPNIVIKFAKG